MTTLLRVVPLIALALFWALPAFAAEDATAVDVNQGEMAEIERGERATDDPVAGVESLPSHNQRRLSPMHQEIVAQLEAEEIALAQLQAEFESAPNARAAHAIEKRIAELKQSTELEVLKIQLRHAEERQDAEASHQLQDAIESLENPQNRALPQSRPAPAARGQ